MATIKEVIRYNIGQCSDAIHAIKKSVEYIHPGHASWARYRQLKREASIWLTALSLAKVGEGERSAPAIHAGCCRRKTILRTATRRLQGIAGRLSRNPSKYLRVDAWVANRSATQEAVVAS